MAKYEDGTFEDTRVDLDGNQFTNCSFRGCTLVYSGGTDVGIVGCNFVDCTWELDGAAAATVAFLRGIYHGIQDGDGQQVVRQLWQQIEQP